MVLLEELRRTIEAAALGELSYEELDRRLNFKFYDLGQDAMHSPDAEIVNSVLEHREAVILDPTPEQLVGGWHSPETFMEWLRTAWRQERERMSRTGRGAV